MILHECVALSLSGSGFDSQCARSDCFRPDSSNAEYIIEKIVGRKQREGEGRVAHDFKWLIKWEGLVLASTPVARPMSELNLFDSYAIEQSTWEEEVVPGEWAKLQDEFYETATSEGQDIDLYGELLLLKEAAHMSHRGVVAAT